jgi:hypothetical protein
MASRTKVPQLLQENGNGNAPGKMRFHVTLERVEIVPIGLAMDIEEKTTTQNMIELLILFVADADGNYLPKEEARLAVRDLTLGELRDATEAIKGFMGSTTVPNE